MGRVGGEGVLLGSCYKKTLMDFDMKEGDPALMNVQHEAPPPAVHTRPSGTGTVQQAGYRLRYERTGPAGRVQAQVGTHRPR